MPTAFPLSVSNDPPILNAQTHPIAVRPTQPDLASRVQPASGSSTSGSRSGGSGGRLNPDRGGGGCGGLDPGGRGPGLLSLGGLGSSRGPSVGSSSSGLLNRGRSGGRGSVGNTSSSTGAGGFGRGSGRTGTGTSQAADTTPLLPDPTSLSTAPRSTLLDPPLGVGLDGPDFRVGPVLKTGLLESTGEVVVVVGSGGVGERGGFGARDGLWVVVVRRSSFVVRYRVVTGRRGHKEERQGRPSVSLCHTRNNNDIRSPRRLTAINIDPKMRGEAARYCKSPIIVESLRIRWFECIGV